MEIYRNTNPEVPFIAENNMVEPYVCVELGAGDQEVDLPNAVTDTVVGVAQHSASAGEAVNVQISGITLLTAGGAVTKGARLHLTGSAGRVASNLDGTVGTKYVGLALESAVAGEVFSALINLPNVAEDGGAA